MRTVMAFSRRQLANGTNARFHSRPQKEELRARSHLSSKATKTVDTFSLLITFSLFTKTERRRAFTRMVRRRFVNFPARMVTRKSHRALRLSEAKFSKARTSNR